MERELSCPWGYVLNKPCYTKGDDHIGRVSYREFRGAVYNIEIQNPKGLETGKVSMTLDGKHLSGNLLPVLGDGKEHQVKVVMDNY